MPHDRLSPIDRSFLQVETPTAHMHVAGRLRRLALAAGSVPAPVKAMVPVSRREPGDCEAPGNRIAFASVTLPLDVRTPLRRLDAIATQTRAFKASGRAAGSETLLGALGILPPLPQDVFARYAASARAYNVVVSNVPGPRVPVYLLGARCVDALPVIPLSEGRRHPLDHPPIPTHEGRMNRTARTPEELRTIGRWGRPVRTYPSLRTPASPGSSPTPPAGPPRSPLLSSAPSPRRSGGA